MKRTAMNADHDGARISRRRIRHWFRLAVECDQGLTIVEYAIAAGLIGGAVVVTFSTFGKSIKQVIDFVILALT